MCRKRQRRAILVQMFLNLDVTIQDYSPPAEVRSSLYVQRTLQPAAAKSAAH
jgi:hypothetical protein